MSWFRDRPPYLLPPIAVEYHRCRRCESLLGGIFGKGPLASLRTEGAPRCRHAWERVDKAVFDAAARATFGEGWFAIAFPGSTEKQEWWERLPSS